MKGIAHFASGLCLASFVPGVVESAAQGSLLIALGGACALLPDTLDFKFARYFERAESVDPDPAHLDPQAIADQIAALIDRRKVLLPFLFVLRAAVVDAMLVVGKLLLMVSFDLLLILGALNAQGGELLKLLALGIFGDRGVGRQGNLRHGRCSH